MSKSSYKSKSLQSIIVGFLLILPISLLAQSNNQGSFLEQAQQAQTTQDSIRQNSILLDDVDSLVVSDTTNLEEKAPAYIERDYNHKEQVITGGVIMLCIGIILVTSNNFNPKH